MPTLTVTSTNNELDFKENGGAQKTATVSAGSYTPQTLASALASAMTSAGTLTYTADYNGLTGIFTVYTSLGNNLSLLFSTGTNAGQTIGYLLGFNSTISTISDFTGTNSYAGLQSVDPSLAIVDYYADLLILQYSQKPNAYGTIQTVVQGEVMDQLPAQVQAGFNLNPTVQTITFSSIPASGNFSIAWEGATSSTIAWNAPLATIQAAANSLFGIGNVTVTGAMAAKWLTFTFNIDTAPLLITIAANTLEDVASTAITAAVSSNLAVGTQLDVLGKYCGVTRSGFGTSGPITLDDADFYRLIQLAVITNNSGSSLATIQNLLAKYFPQEILVFDYANTTPMRMAYYVNTSLGSLGLIQLFISEGLLPKPMGVQLSVIGAPIVNEFFGFCDYNFATPTNPNTANINGWNCATSYTLGNYNTGWPFLDYADSLL